MENDVFRSMFMRSGKNRDIEIENPQAAPLRRMVLLTVMI